MEQDLQENITANMTPKNDVIVTAKGIISDFQKREVDWRYHRSRRSKVVQPGFDTSWPAGA